MSCGTLAGVYTGVGSAPGGEAPWAWALEADPCWLKGGIEVAGTLVPVEGALCSGTSARVSSSGPGSELTGTVTFEPTGAVSGELSLRLNGHAELDAGEYTIALSGARLQVTVPNEPCSLLCDDGNVCTVDTCLPDQDFACSNVQAPPGAPCDDGDACTVADACVSGQCVGSPIQCDDENVCTTDSCDPLTGSCVHQANTLACDDKNACTINDACSNSVCVGEPLASCCGNFSCEPGEDCSSCPEDCAGVTTGPAPSRYCCGNGTQEAAEGDGSICDGNY